MAGPGARPSSSRILERPPAALLRRVARIPLVLFRLRMDRFLGHRLLVIGHRGRRSGRLYHTVLEVVRWDPRSCEATVAAGWGERASWYRNLQASPAVEVQIAGARYEPQQRFLTLEERVRVLRDYQRDHRLTAIALRLLLGLDLKADLERAAEALPMVAFRPSVPEIPGVPTQGGSVIC